MNKPDLQLNLISWSCWGTVVLHVGMQHIFGESNMRVDCVASISGLAFCYVVSDRVCMGMRPLGLCIDCS